MTYSSQRYRTRHGAALGAIVGIGLGAFLWAAGWAAVAILRGLAR